MSKRPSAKLKARSDSKAANSDSVASLSRLLLCFFLSGCAGLIYQIVWTKSLGLLFGYSAYAVATVLAVFMGGLAAGSLFLGQKMQWKRGAIASYAYLEFAIAISGALSLAGLAVVRSVYLHLYPAAFGSPIALLILRFLGAAAVLLIPTFLMGATLPILIRGVSQQSAQFARQLGRFYALNTIGAVVGTLVAGFVLLPWLGLRLTLAVAVILNLCAGFLAMQTPDGTRDIALGIAGDAPVPGKLRAKTAVFDSAIPTRYLLALFFLVGATAIAYEISWTRLLATMLGSSTYAFSLMLATFLAGIAIGSLLFEKWIASGGAVSILTFAHTQLFTAVSALLFLLLFRQFPALIPILLRATQSSFGGLIFTQFLIAAFAMLPAAILFGINFPAVIVLIQKSEPAANNQATVARAYAMNTFGAVFAALLVGFLILPRVGAFRMVALTAVASLTIAAFLHWYANRKIAVAAAYAVLTAVILFVGYSPFFYSRALANFGAVLYAGSDQHNLTIDEVADTEDVVFFKDGVNATIAVAQSEDYLALKTNGKVDASTVDISTQLLLGDLGAIFHPRPKRVLVIGFGSGMTASAVARFPDVERIDCVEIEPAVVQAAPHLTRLNRGVLSDLRVHIIYDDARNFIQSSREPYDLVISEPSNPWIAGIAALYTTEFYSEVRKRLAPGGMFVQWVQAYSLEPQDFRMILATISAHFADVSLWHSADRDFMVLARTDDLPLNFDRSRSFWTNPLLREDFDALHLAAPEGWPVYFRLGNSEINKLINTVDINTDDKNRLEYRAPRSLLNDSLTQQLSQLVDSYRGDVLPEFLDPRERSASLAASAASAVDLPNSSPEPFFAAAAHNGEPDFATTMAKGRQALNDGQPALGVQIFQLAIARDPASFDARYWQAKAYQLLGNSAQAQAEVVNALEISPRNSTALQLRIELARNAREWPTAVVLQQQLLATVPDLPASENCRLGDLYLRTGNAKLAEPPLRDGLAIEPYSFLCHRDLGELLRATGRAAEAQTNLEFAVKYFPSEDAKVYASLAMLYQASGKHRDAQNILGKGRRIFPQDAFLQQFVLKP